MFTYLPGAGDRHNALALVIGQHALLIESTARPELVQQLWAHLRERPLDAIVTELSELSGRELPHLALLALAPAGGSLATIACSGTGEVALDDGQTFTGSDRFTVTQLAAEGLGAVSLRLGAVHSTGAALQSRGSASMALPLLQGVVHCIGLTWHAEGASQPATGLPAAELPAVGLRAAELPAAGLPAAELPATGLPAAAPAEQITNQFDHLFEHTQSFDVESAAVRRPAADGHDGSQPPASVPRATAPPSLPAAAAPQAPHPAAQPALALELPDGTLEPLDLPVIIGRQPAAPHDAALGSVRLVKLSARASGLSRVHARLDPDEGAVFVTDLGSTNGTSVIPGTAPGVAAARGDRANGADRASGADRANGADRAAAARLSPGVPHRANPGDRILLGGVLSVGITTAGHPTAAG